MERLSEYYGWKIVDSYLSKTLVAGLLSLWPLINIYQLQLMLIMTTHWWFMSINFMYYATNQIKLTDITKSHPPTTSNYE